MNTVYTLMRKELVQRRWSVLAYSLIAFALIWLYIALYPSVQEQSAEFNKLFEAYPKALFEAFNIEQIQLGTVAGYILVEHFSFVWQILAILLALSMAGQSIAGEIERGTMAMLLSMSFGRLRLCLSKYLAGLAILLVFILFSVVSIIPLTSVMNLSISAANVWRTALVSFCFAWAIYAVSMMVSAAVRERSRVYFIVGGSLLLMYVAKIFSGLVDNLEKLKYVSFFYYYSPDKALVKGELSLQPFLVFGGIAVVATLVGMIIFIRRDISV